MKSVIVGCGQVAPIHVRAIRRSGKSTLAAVCDVDQKRATTFAGRHNIGGVYNDLGMMLEWEQPDIVHITTPPHTHAPLAIQALEAGRHVLVEKPMCLSVAEADRMIAAAQASGVKLCVDHNYLFRPSVQKARALVDAGQIGRIIYAHAYYGIEEGRDYGGGAKSAHWAWQLPGGVFTNFVPHMLYLQMAFLGVLDTVSGLAAYGKQNSPDEPLTEVSFLLQGQGGIGINTLSMDIRPYAKFVDIYGTNGRVHIDLANEICTSSKERAGSRKLSKLMSPLEESSQLALSAISNGVKVATRQLSSYPDLPVLVDRFYTSIEQNQEPPVTGVEGRQVVHALELLRAQAGSQGIRGLQ